MVRSRRKSDFISSKFMQTYSIMYSTSFSDTRDSGTSAENGSLSSTTYSASKHRINLSFVD